MTDATIATGKIVLCAAVDSVALIDGKIC